MKRTTVIVPMLLPSISDTAAVQLLDILEQLLACVRHHYAPQVQRRQRRQRNRAPPAQRPPDHLDIGDLF